MSTTGKASAERVAELSESLSKIELRVQAASSRTSTLVAVSKYKPSSDILVCFENGQLDFGENYVQELVEKAEVLPSEIRWHFIGTLQSNKAKMLASIPNLRTIQTLTSSKVATALNKTLPPHRETPIMVLIQINTSGEDSKSGLAPLTSLSNVSESQVALLANHIIGHCPRLKLEGLMTIGNQEQSLNASTSDQNLDFERLKETRDLLQQYLINESGKPEVGKWGRENSLVLSMGMSCDFEAALKAGSDIVRVGTGIFGQRPLKTLLTS